MHGAPEGCTLFRLPRGCTVFPPLRQIPPSQRREAHCRLNRQCEPSAILDAKVDVASSITRLPARTRRCIMSPSSSSFACPCRLRRLTLRDACSRRGRCPGSTLTRRLRDRHRGLDLAHAWPCNSTEGSGASEGPPGSGRTRSSIFASTGLDFMEQLGAIVFRGRRPNTLENSRDVTGPGRSLRRCSSLSLAS